MNERPKRLIVIGLEGLSPELLQWAVTSGRCPRLADLAGRGALTPVYVTPPGDVASSWATFASGSLPQEHGVAGLRPYAVDTDCGSAPNVIAAEEEARRGLGRRGSLHHFWTAAAEAGKRVFAVDFPGAWPPAHESVGVITGSGPLVSPEVRLTEGHLFATRPSPAESPTHLLRTTQPSGWANPPESARAPLEIAFIVTGDAELQPTDYGWMATPRGDEVPRVDPSLMYCGLVVSSGNALDADGRPSFDKLILCRGRDALHPAAILRPGEWSDWLTEELQGPGARATVRFRFQLRGLSPGGREIALYRTPMFRTEGWASPLKLAERLTDAAVQEAPDVLGHTEETLQQHAVGVAWTCGQLCTDGEWDMLLAHVPLPDTILHEVLNKLHPASPQYRAGEEPTAWERIGEAMALADQFIDSIITDCYEDGDVVAIVSPNGMIPTRKYVWLGKAFVEAGLAIYVIDEESGGMRLYRPDSRAILVDYPLAQGVWVNLEGRQPDGTVPPEQYEHVRTEIINALLSVRDPFTNTCPVAMALRREETGFLGSASEALADVIYFMAPGYATDPRICSSGLINPTFIPVDGVCGSVGHLQGVHHGYMPGAALGGFSTNGLLLLAGRGVRQGAVRREPLRLPDVTATLCHLVPIPAQTAGLVAVELLDL